MNYHDRVKPIFREEYNKIVTEYHLNMMDLKEEKGLRNVLAFKRKILWAFDNAIPQLHISFGNRKLPKTTCIINLGSWFNCSGRKEGYCEICKECYDKQVEVRFKERIKSRLEHEIYFRTLSAKRIAYEIIKRIKKRMKNHVVNLIRWAEVGELRNQSDLNKVIEISNIIFRKLRIKSYIYTHNKKLNFNLHRPHLTINGSGFMVDNEYRVVKDERKELCKPGLNAIFLENCICDCTRCSYCSEKANRILVEELR